MESDNKFISEKIAHYRKLKGITQEQLAESCNLNVRTIQRIEAGEVDPRLYTLKSIAEALNISMESLIPPPPEKDKSSLVMLHLCSFAYFLFPFGGNVFGPLIFWIYKKDKVNHIDREGKRVLNAQISYWIYSFLVLTPIFYLIIKHSIFILISITGLTFVLLSTLMTALFFILFPAISAWRANKRKSSYYPLRVKFLKEET